MSSTLSSNPARTKDEPPRRRRRWLIVVAVIGAVLVTFAGVAIGRYAFRAHPGPKAVEAAVDRFRTLPTHAPPTDVRYPFPAAGVYELEGQGSERISFPSNSQRDGRLMPATLSYGADGCWVWHVDYNVAHAEDYQFCPRGDVLALAGSGNTQTWNFGFAKVMNVAHFTCEPPATVLSNDPQPSETYSRVCSGTNSAISGLTTTTTTTRIVGRENLLIGGVAHPAIHQQQQTAITGGQTGAETADWWLSPTNGLPLRMERHIRLDTRSPLGGTITYTEEGFWQLRNLEPQT